MPQHPHYIPCSAPRAYYGDPNQGNHCFHPVRRGLQHYSDRQDPGLCCLCHLREDEVTQRSNLFDPSTHEIISSTPVPSITTPTFRPYAGAYTQAQQANLSSTSSVSYDTEAQRFITWGQSEGTVPRTAWVQAPREWTLPQTTWSPVNWVSPNSDNSCISFSPLSETKPTPEPSYECEEDDGSNELKD